MKYFTWKHQTMLHFLCSCSYFVHVPPVFSVLSTYSLKINSLLSWPILYMYVQPTSKELSRVIGRLTQWKSDFLWSSLVKSKGSVGYRSWSRFLAVSLQVTWVINPAVRCHYFPPGLQLPPQPLKGLLPILLLGEQRHDGCEQFA